MRTSVCISLLICLAVPACRRPIYDWGSYEESVFRMYSSREDFSAAKELDRLRQEVDRTQRRGRRVPPGKMAHLGYLFLMAGDSENAGRYFEMERVLFPEGDHFMTFLISRQR